MKIEHKVCDRDVIKGIVITKRNPKTTKTSRHPKEWIGEREHGHSLLCSFFL